MSISYVFECVHTYVCNHACATSVTKEKLHVNFKKISSKFNVDVVEVLGFIE